MTQEPAASWDHPDNLVYNDLWETIALATRWLREPGNVLDDEMAERLASACDAARRYCADEHCEPPPPWLTVLTELFQAMQASVRVTTTIVSTAQH